MIKLILSVILEIQYLLQLERGSQNGIDSNFGFEGEVIYGEDKLNVGSKKVFDREEIWHSVGKEML